MVAWVKRRDRADVFEAVAYQAAPHPPMTDVLAARCARAVHVLGPDGSLLAAGRACLFVLGKLGWPRLARVLSLPPFVWLVEAGYWLVARNRGFFSLFLFRK
ncbi:MAG: DUF393 domain-containing protein [Candidatus Rokubacteria bacterium]|nr:DUF393 domain-containing protein [Candidatus Rokubacteria bacterium]